MTEETKTNEISRRGSEEGKDALENVPRFGGRRGGDKKKGRPVRLKRKGEKGARGARFDNGT